MNNTFLMFISRKAGRVGVKKTDIPNGDFGMDKDV